MKSSAVCGSNKTDPGAMPMHICFASREYPPSPMGGIGTYVANMTRILADGETTVSVLTQAHPDAQTRGIDNPAISCEGRLRVYYLPFVDSAWRLLPEARNAETEALLRRDVAAAFGPVLCDALEKLLAREEIDAIEAPEYEAPLLHFQQKRAALPPAHPWRRMATLVHLHSPSHMIFEHDDDPLTNRWVRARKAREALSMELADGLISPSASLAGEVSRWLRLPEGRIKVTPYPIGPLLAYDEATAPTPGLCLFVGRVEPRKGVFEFVEAAIAAAQKFPHARFRFVGGPHHRGGASDGIETSALIRSCIPEGLRDRFEFAGRVPRETLGDEYRRAAFAVVPSRWDNYPNTCMEAMSCARPVLATDCGGMAEMIEDGIQGIVVPGGKSRGELVRNLNTGLERMLAMNAEELCAMGDRAKARILSICDDAQIARCRIDSFSSLAQEVRTSISESAKAKPLKTAVMLFDDGADPDRTTDALKGVAVQTVEAAARLLVSHSARSRADALPWLKSWTVLATDAEGLRDGLPSLRDRVAALQDEMPDVLYIGAADDILAPDALRQATNFFTNHPEAGCCTCRTASDGMLCAAFRNDPTHLLAPATFPERWFFRTRALRECGGILCAGYHLPDLLRDAVLRLVKGGWRIGGMVCAPVDVAPREPQPLVRPLAFHERRDSVREVALAHKDIFADDPVTLCEALTALTE